MNDYLDFLNTKSVAAAFMGFDIELDDIHPVLLGHQRKIVQWCIAGGRRAIFAAFGLGKSVMQLEIMRQIIVHEGARCLIVCPLGVRQEFARDARDLLGMETRFVRWSDEVTGPGIYLTNYESVRDGRLDPNLFTAASLDEASVLRSFGSKTYQTFLTLFDQVKYRFVATATPSPNRHKELIHYAGFLGIMDTGQALTRFFQRDSEHANNLTIYPHKEREFRLWLHSWATFLMKPSDLGFSDYGYDLPEMELVWHEVDTPHDGQYGADRDLQGYLFRDATLGVSEAARAKRDTLDLRVEKARQLVMESPEDHFVLWHDLEDERRALKRAIPEMVEVYGSQDLDDREDRIIGFSEGQFRLLGAKPVMAGSGCNFQRHCHREIFVGVGFKFNDMIQAVHRVHRFMQGEPVRIDFIYASTERSVVEVLQAKWERHRELVAEMSEVVREFGMDAAAIEEAMRRSIGVERIEASGEGWTYALNDTVPETTGMDDNSVDLIVTSIPFANHYEYTPSYNDFGHTEDNDQFWAQMDFLTPQLLRVLSPGRFYCCHVKDRILFGNTTGFGASTVSPFHAEALMHGLKHGFQYFGMITVVTDVVRENNQSYRLGWTEQCKDGTKMGVGSPEYILLFRKPQTDKTRGYADVPVEKDKAVYTRSRWQTDAHAFWRSNGNRNLIPEDLDEIPTGVRMKLFERWTREHVYDYESHVKLGERLEVRGVLPATFMALQPASPHPDVWSDVQRMRTLNNEQSHKAQVMHVCPLQFDIVDRLVLRFSMEGELVYDPFAGLGTVPMRAMILGRRGRGVELNGGYFTDAVRYLVSTEAKIAAPTLFDLIEAEADEVNA